MFTKIVAPLDGSTLAAGVLPHLMAMINITGAQVTLLRVMVRNDTMPAGVSPVDWQLQKTEAQTYLDEISNRLAAVTNNHAETLVLEGRAADRIIEYAQQAGCDLILLSSHGQSGLHGWNVSSIAQKVIQRAGKSILLIRAYTMAPTAQGDNKDNIRYRRIVAPLDGSPRSEHILPVAAALAEAHDAELLLVHVVTRPPMIQRMPLTAEESALADQLIERNQAQAVKYFEQLRLRLNPAPQTHVLTGDNMPATLHKFVVQQEADLVIMSAHGQSAQRQWPYGSLVTSFIEYGATPLLILQDMASSAIEPTAAELATEAIKRRPMRTNGGTGQGAENMGNNQQGVQVENYVATAI